MPNSQLPPPPMLPDGGPPAENAPQSAKRAWREANAAKQQWYRDAVSQGYSLQEVNDMYNRALNGGQLDPGYGNTKEHGGVPMQHMWSQWQQNGGGLPLGYTFDWANGLMRHDATSDADPNSPTGNQSWQQIPQQWIQQRQQYQDWVRQNQGKVQQSGGDPYAAYLRQWSDYYKQPNYQRPSPPGGGMRPTGMPNGGGISSMNYGGGGPYGSGGGPYGAYASSGGGGDTSGNWFKPGSIEGMFGSISDLTDELGQQSHLDTLMQMMNYQRQMQEYGEGRGMSRFARDFWGDIMGVGFDNPEYSSMLDGYFQDGMRELEQNRFDWAAGGGTSGRPGMPQGRIVRGFEPDGTPSEGQPPIPVPRERDTDRDANKHPKEALSALSGGGGPTPRMDDPRNPAPTPPINPGPTPTPSGPLGTNPPPQPTSPNGTTPPVPNTPPVNNNTDGVPNERVAMSSRYGQLPKLPALPNSGYHMLTNGYDPGNDKSWGMLARPAQAIAADNDAQQSMIQRMMPAGGERDLASAQALNSGFGKIGDLRQSLVSTAMDNIQRMGTESRFGAPMSPASGSGQSLLGNAMQARGGDQQYDLGLQQLTQQAKFPWAQIGMSLGGNLAGILAGRRTS